MDFSHHSSLAFFHNVPFLSRTAVYTAKTCTAQRVRHSAVGFRFRVAYAPWRACRNSSCSIPVKALYSEDEDGILTPELEERILEQINGSKVVLYMKGSPDAPQCGFSWRAARMLKELGADFKTVDILKDQSIREGIKVFSSWPTIPQLFVGGEFVGGCDIMEELYMKGELTKILADVDAL